MADPQEDRRRKKEEGRQKTGVRAGEQGPRPCCVSQLSLSLPGFAGLSCSERPGPMQPQGRPFRPRG
ncbi:hypothetical protein K466DRAFT_162003 [Polyporus arcularius HHB13444]|uniref:Uncharacterized protein n=1 Tax=Polyporus arcularius HHB13444 TaxID=1314778 RepID=A0A5C3PA92_9APHY|nr:hypothetical protein K466DRAFT_162003 [Polyporus arcularius HHB13444]